MVGRVERHIITALNLTEKHSSDVVGAGEGYRFTRDIVALCLALLVFLLLLFDPRPFCLAFFSLVKLVSR
jgi:hypothetical protein